MTRYDLYVNTEYDTISAGMEEQHDGDYVKWEDVQEFLKKVSKDAFDDHVAYYLIMKEFEL